MKMLAGAVTLLVVLGVCLPSYGEVLVYKFTLSGTYFEQRDGEWGANNRTFKGYLVMDVDYGDSTIVQTQSITYQRDESGKWFEQGPMDLQLVRVELGTKVQWITIGKDFTLEGEGVVAGDFGVTAGAARNRNIGTEVKHEVATAMTGYNLSDGVRENGRDLIMLKLSATFYPAWTYWANGDGDDEGNQDFDATIQMITAYLTGKGYTERNN
jgi:hypothetical protein